MTAIKGSRASINKVAEIELDWGEYTETITCCVTYLQGEDFIIGKLALWKNKAVIQVGPYPVTIYPEEKEPIKLELWKQINPLVQGIISSKTVMKYIDDTVIFDSDNELNTEEINTSEDEQQNRDEWIKDPLSGAWFKENSQAEKEMIMT